MGSAARGLDVVFLLFASNPALGAASQDGCRGCAERVAPNAHYTAVFPAVDTDMDVLAVFLLESVRFPPFFRCAIGDDFGLCL